MYACIDEVTDRIQRKLRRFKERKITETRGRPGVAGLLDEVVIVFASFHYFCLLASPLSSWPVFGFDVMMTQMIIHGDYSVYHGLSFSLLL